MTVEREDFERRIHEDGYEALYTVHAAHGLSYSTGGANFVDGVATDVRGHVVRRLICAMGPNAFERVELQGAEPAAEAMDPGEMTVDDVADLVEGIDDYDELERLYRSEQGGKQRKGALRAIAARARTLAAGEDEAPEGASREAQPAPGGPQGQDPAQGGSGEENGPQGGPTAPQPADPKTPEDPGPSDEEE